MNEQWLIIIVVTGTFALAGAVKGIIGFGLPTVVMGLLGVVMPPAQAAALLVVPSLATNGWQTLDGHHLWLIVKRLWSMLLCIIFGTFLGIGLLIESSLTITSAVLGVVLTAYGAASLLAPRLAVSPAWEWWLSPVMGIFTGLLAGASGIFVIPAVPYLNSLGLSKEILIQSLGLTFTVSTLALGAGLAFNGAYPVALAGNSLLALFPALAGMVFGRWIRSRLQPAIFRKWFLVSLLLLGLYMMTRAARTALF